MGKSIKTLIVVATGVIIWYLPPPAGVHLEAWRLLAIFAATIVGFISQPLPIGAIAFLSLVISTLSGVMKLSDALSGFSNSTIWLIISAFLLAKGFIKTGLGRRIAYIIIRAIGGSTLRLGYAMMLSDLIIAPAMPSSTARAGGVMFPIVRSLASALDSEPGPSSRKIGAYLMQTTFQCVVISATMFVTSSAPNSLIVLLAAQTAHIQITWGIWALAGIVPGLISLIMIPFVMYKLYPPEMTKTPRAKQVAADELVKMGPVSYAEKVVAGVFVMALLLWSTSQWTNIDATVVAMLGVGVMLVLAAISWQDVLEEKGAWDTMLWMGTLIGLAGTLNTSGLIAWFAKSVALLISGVPWIMAVFALAVLYIVSHYLFASTSAHITAMYATFLAVALAAGAPPFFAAMSLSAAANICGNITHYSLGSAPIFFGAGYVSQSSWWKLGFIFSVINMIIWFGLGWVWWKVIGLW